MMKSEHTRAQIIERAAELFEKRSFDGTSMRILAKECGLSSGAFYYYFKSKDEIVLEFYRRNMKVFAARAQESLAKERSLRKRLAAFYSTRIETMGPERHLFLVLARAAVDPESPLSPFSAETQAIRDEAIGLAWQAIEPEFKHLAPEVRDRLATIVWMSLLGIILFWTFDRSSRQRATAALIENVSAWTARGLKAASAPVIGRAMTRALAELFEIARQACP